MIHAMYLNDFGAKPRSGDQPWSRDLRTGWCAYRSLPAVHQILTEGSSDLAILLENPAINAGDLMRVALISSATLLLVCLAGCGEPRQVGDVYVQGSAASYNYYGEARIKPEAGKDRIYLLSDPKTVAAFAAGSNELPLSKTLIGAGPNKETMMIEQVKDPAQSLIVTRRLITTFNQHNNAAVNVP